MNLGRSESHHSKFEAKITLVFKNYLTCMQQISHGLAIKRLMPADYFLYIEYFSVNSSRKFPFLEIVIHWRHLRE